MKALVQVDTQKGFIDGSLANPFAQEAMPIVEKVVKYAVDNAWFIYQTQDTHYRNYLETQEGKNLPIVHTQYGTEDWEIDSRARVRENYPYIRKLLKNQFGYNNWQTINMNQYEEIVIIGFVSSICVISNALILKALFPEVPLVFITDASAGLNEENHAATIEVMKSCQIKCMTWKEYLKED